MINNTPLFCWIWFGNCYELFYVPWEINFFKICKNDFFIVIILKNIKILIRTGTDNYLSYWWIKDIYVKLPYHYKKNLKGNFQTFLCLIYNYFNFYAFEFLFTTKTFPILISNYIFIVQLFHFKSYIEKSLLISATAIANKRKLLFNHCLAKI